MLCSGCGVEVSERQKFCHECGIVLHPRAGDDGGGETPDETDDEHAPSSRGLLPTQPVAIISDPVTGMGDDADGDTGDDSADVTDGQADDTGGPDEADEADEAEGPDATDGPDAAEHSEVQGDRPIALLPTEPIATTAAFPASTTTTIDADLPTQPVASTPADADLPTEPIATTDDPAGEPTEAIGVEAMSGGVSTARGEPWVDEAPTTPLASTAWPAAVDPSAASVTEEMPAIFDGDPDLVEFPPGGEPFRVRLIFVLALFGAAAVLMSMVADVIDLRTTRPEPGIVTGVRMLEQLGTNLGLAGFVGAAVMVIGGLLACFGLRWGAGLAGGAGLALVGWAALTIGLAEFPIAVAESITRTSSELFTLRVTRDIGWWLIVGVGVVGALVFLASLRSIGSGGRAALNPIIAALTAVAVVILAFGPLVPMNGASITDNFRSTDPTRDLPTAFFAGRLTQVALIAIAGVLGMLIVRSWGLGLAVGSLSVPIWLWISSLGEIGSNPVGIADRNPGATSTVPNAVTTVGMVASLLLLAIASVLATIRLTRSRPPR